MSFRNRLTLFFVLIVVVPMVSVAFVLFRLISDNETGKSDARIAARQNAAINLYGEDHDQADRAAVTIGRDPALAAALRSGDKRAIVRRARALLAAQGVRRILILDPAGAVLADVGDPNASFPAERRLIGQSGKRFGTLQVAVTDPRSYAGLVQRVTGLHTVVHSGDRILASTLAGVQAAALPRTRGDVRLGGVSYRAATYNVPGFRVTPVQVTLLQSREQTTSDVQRSRLLAGGILLGFFILAFTFAVLVSRSLQRQIDSFLIAARRLGSGDFSTQVPTSGRDEFAQLGQEFNKMSQQLEERLAELGRERERLQEAMRRIGETFASNLDRDALLEIVVRTAVDGVGAEVGRAAIRSRDGGRLEQVATVGRVDGLEQVLSEVEAQALRSGEPSEAQLEEAVALSHPLRRRDGEGPGEVAGLVSIARPQRAFTSAETDLFHYLAGQAEVSIENVGLHETVERQAVTDELTGLSNRRRFQEAMQTEIERSRRFGQQLGLVMLDIDDFKQVNDRYGHVQGDLVLREVARVLRESSREIDEPARYGGEELAVVLPGTDLQGAYNLAERVRTGIEALRLPLLDGEGTLTVTASFGVATLPGSGYDMRSLIEAADEALYKAKRTGKNRTVRAG
jgi:diguanylate cyclase (GGDEF)-like protein